MLIFAVASAMSRRKAALVAGSPAVHRRGGLREPEDGLLATDLG
ncbi:hypothetical protein [Nocardioides pantholopis]|nr:hypothetical protein [Nocardioides pantholopis]